MRGAEASLLVRAPGEDAAAAGGAAVPGAECQHTWEPRLDTECARSSTVGPGQELPCTEQASPCSVCYSPAKQAALSIFPAGATRRIRQVIYSQFIFIFLLAGMRSYTKIWLLGESVSFPPQESSAPYGDVSWQRPGAHGPLRVCAAAVPAAPAAPLQFPPLHTPRSSATRCVVVAPLVSL